MDANKYQQLALRTESTLQAVNEEGNFQPYTMNRLLHAALGLQTEAGEFADPIKKELFYAKIADRVNLREELGDLLWYIAIACDALGTTMGAEMQRNIDKLRARYPEKFTEHHANNRDLTHERRVLEG